MVVKRQGLKGVANVPSESFNASILRNKSSSSGLYSSSTLWQDIKKVTSFGDECSQVGKICRRINTEGFNDYWLETT